jgi:phosphoglycolate phosphatase-like HAD superfamily hydrolase
MKQQQQCDKYYQEQGAKRARQMKPVAVFLVLLLWLLALELGWLVLTGKI